MSREPVDPATSATGRGSAAVEAARLALQPRSLEQIRSLATTRTQMPPPPHTRDHRSTDEPLTILLEEERSHGN